MNSDYGDAVLKAFGAVALVVTAVVVGVTVRGWVLATMWVWFIVPIFHLPSLTIPQAIGVSMVLALLTKDTASNADDKKSTAEKWAHAGATILVAPVVTLGLGWIVLQFM